MRLSVVKGLSANHLKHIDINENNDVTSSIKCSKIKDNIDTGSFFTELPRWDKLGIAELSIS